MSKAEGSGESEEELVTLSTKIPKELKKQLQFEAVERGEGVYLSDVAREVLEIGWEEYERKHDRD